MTIRKDVKAVLFMLAVVLLIVLLVSNAGALLLGAKVVLIAAGKVAGIFGTFVSLAKLAPVVAGAL